MSIPLTLGAQLRQARLDGQWTLRSLAIRLDCQPSFLTALEEDRADGVPVADAWLRQLAGLLRLDPAHVLTERHRVRQQRRAQAQAIAHQHETARYGATSPWEQAR